MEAEGAWAWLQKGSKAWPSVQTFVMQASLYVSGFSRSVLASSRERRVQLSTPSVTSTMHVPHSCLPLQLVQRVTDW